MPNLGFNDWLARVFGLVLLVLLQACASGPNAHPGDPFEPFNRTVYKVNDGLDRALIKPVATAYQTVVPKLARTGVSNFFGNIADVWSTANNVMQLKPLEAAESLMRVSVNTVFGIGGIFDVASEMRIAKHSEDFGQTLGYWGMPPGPFLMLPLLGPSSARDAVGTAVDLQGNLASKTESIPTRNSLTALGILNVRAGLLDAGDLLDKAAIDKYSFLRDAYLQRRVSLIGREVDTKEERFDLPEPEAEPKASPQPAVPAAPAAAAVN